MDPNTSHDILDSEFSQSSDLPADLPADESHADKETPDQETHVTVIQDGDRIVIDVEKKQLDMLVSDEEIAARLAAWKRPEPKFKKGWLGLYCKIAASGSEGAVLKYDKL